MKKLLLLLFLTGCAGKQTTLEQTPEYIAGFEDAITKMYLVCKNGSRIAFLYNTSDKFICVESKHVLMPKRG